MAWLHSVPGEEKISRMEKISRLDSEDERLSRNEGLRLNYLIDFLFEIGPCLENGPLTYTEILSWCNLTAVDLNGDEATTIKVLSEVYFYGLREYKSKSAMSPRIIQNEDYRKTVDAVLGNHLRFLAKSNKNRKREKSNGRS